MTNPITFYFDYISPFAYLAWTQMRGLSARTGRPFEMLPVNVLSVMDKTGNTPTTALCEAKRNHARADLVRWSKRYVEPLNRHPLHGQFPTAPLHLAYLGALALGQQEAAMKCFFEAMWVAPTDVNSDEGAIKVMANAGIENAETLWANRAANQARMDEIEEQAVQDGVFGVPSFVVDGRIYFGNDRLMFLEEELV